MAVGLCALSFLLPACGATIAENDAPAVPVHSGPPLSFRWGSTEGDVVDSEALRGRVTVLLFIATFDMASQLMARQANELLHRYQPRINVAAVVMEPPAYAPLKGTFKQTLELDYPVAMADFATLEGRGPVNGIVHIPTTLVLDRQGRETQRFLGPVKGAELEEALKDAR